MWQPSTWAWHRATANEHDEAIQAHESAWVEYAEYL